MAVILNRNPSFLLFLLLNMSLAIAAIGSPTSEEPPTTTTLLPPTTTETSATILQHPEQPAAAAVLPVAPAASAPRNTEGPEAQPVGTEQPPPTTTHPTTSDNDVEPAATPEHAGATPSSASTTADPVVSTTASNPAPTIPASPSSSLSSSTAEAKPDTEQVPTPATTATDTPNAPMDSVATPTEIVPPTTTDIDTAEAQNAVPGDIVYDDDDHVTTEQTGGLSKEAAALPVKPRVNFASDAAGAALMESSEGFKHPHNLLNFDQDQYALTPCSTPKKYVTVSLSEEATIDTIVFLNTERFSSTFNNIQVLGSMSYPTKEWVMLGAVDFLSGVKDDQEYALEHPAMVRYLKLRFRSHHGKEYYCTMTTVKAYGSTAMDTVQGQLDASVSAVFGCCLLLLVVHPVVVSCLYPTF
jgi:hypothetical protein